MRAAYEYFHQKLDVDLKQAVSVFKQARFFNPAKIGELKPSCADIDDLKASPGLRSGAILEGLEDELPIYMATADGCHCLSVSYSGGPTMRVNYLSGCDEVVFTLVKQFHRKTNQIYGRLHRDLCHGSIQQSITGS